ncbi:hypothetical protein ASZ90_017444 [hydrocarbon metagenome]|uniref:Uncharacterized protein n=1 Tax=hydrocarbon metagenome TaxID=938273 RepID=A0A0W8E9I9_9ZZZZ
MVEISDVFINNARTEGTFALFKDTEALQPRSGAVVPIMIEQNKGSIINDHRYFHRRRGGRFNEWG